MLSDKIVRDHCFRTIVRKHCFRTIVCEHCFRTSVRKHGVRTTVCKRRFSDNCPQTLFSEKVSASIVFVQLPVRFGQSFARFSGICPRTAFSDNCTHAVFSDNAPQAPFSHKCPLPFQEEASYLKNMKIKTSFYRKTFPVVPLFVPSRSLLPLVAPCVPRRSQFFLFV